MNRRGFFATLAAVFAGPKLAALAPKVRPSLTFNPLLLHRDCFAIVWPTPRSFGKGRKIGDTIHVRRPMRFKVG